MSDINILEPFKPWIIH